MLVEAQLAIKHGNVDPGTDVEPVLETELKLQRDITVIDFLKRFQIKG